MDLRLKFDEDVINYDNMRPTYVKDLYEDVIRFIGLDGSKSALEIGMGTGQATLPFLQTGCKLTAIELGESLAAYCANKFSSYDTFRIIHGDFETVPLEDNSYDLIYAATAFHWISEDTGYTKVFKLLKSGGTVALFWNHPVPGEGAFAAAIQAVHDKHDAPSQSSVHSVSDENCFAITETMKKYGFIDVAYKLYHNTRFLSASQYMALLNTYSDHRAKQEENRIQLEKELTDVINRFGGVLDVHDTMDLYLARKP